MRSIKTIKSKQKKKQNLHIIYFNKCLKWLIRKLEKNKNKNLKNKLYSTYQTRRIIKLTKHEEKKTVRQLAKQRGKQCIKIKKYWMYLNWTR